MEMNETVSKILRFYSKGLNKALIKIVLGQELYFNKADNLIIKIRTELAVLEAGLSFRLGIS